MAESVRAADEETILEEIAAQLALLKNLELPPRYLDCHMVFHLQGHWAQRLFTFCRAHGLLFAHHPRYRSTGSIPNHPECARRALADTGHTPVAVFHPAYEDEASRGFRKLHHEANGARARAEEARFLADREALWQLSEAWRTPPPPPIWKGNPSTHGKPDPNL